MSKKKKEFVQEESIESLEPVISDNTEVQVREPKKQIIQKKKIDFSSWTYKQMLEYCESNKINISRMNPQQIRTMLQERI